MVLSRAYLYDAQNHVCLLQGQYADNQYVTRDIMLETFLLFLLFNAYIC